MCVVKLTQLSKNHYKVVTLVNFILLFRETKIFLDMNFGSDPVKVN